MHDKKKALGDYGEKIVLDYMKSLNIEAERSNNPFDMVGDIYFKDCFGVLNAAEVKTLTKIFKYDSFCIEKNQWNKLDEADAVFFINVPLKKHEESFIYKLAKKKKDYVTMIDPFNKGGSQEVRMYSISNMHRLAKISSEDTEQLFEYSFSTYKRG